MKERRIAAPGAVSYFCHLHGQVSRCRRSHTPLCQIREYHRSNSMLTIWSCQSENVSQLKPRTLNLGAGLHLCIFWNTQSPPKLHKILWCCWWNLPVCVGAIKSTQLLLTKENHCRTVIDRVNPKCICCALLTWLQAFICSGSAANCKDDINAIYDEFSKSRNTYQMTYWSKMFEILCVQTVLNELKIGLEMKLLTKVPQHWNIGSDR